MLGPSLRMQKNESTPPPLGYRLFHSFAHISYAIDILVKSELMLIEGVNS